MRQDIVLLLDCLGISCGRARPRCSDIVKLSRCHAFAPLRGAWPRVMIRALR
jgi:hypothetical protein